MQMIEKHKKQQVYADLVGYLEKDIKEHLEFESKAKRLNTGHKCTNIYCKCSTEEASSQ